MKELSEESAFSISIKTLITIGVGLSFAIGGYYSLMQEIKEAKLLPEPAISRTEYELKDELVRETIMNNGKNIEDIKMQLDKIEARLYEIR